MAAFDIRVIGRRMVLFAGGIGKVEERKGRRGVTEKSSVTTTIRVSPFIDKLSPLPLSSFSPPTKMSRVRRPLLFFPSRQSPYHPSSIGSVFKRI